MSSADKIQRILFEEADVRGVVAGLHTSYGAVMERNTYPLMIQKLLGEMLAAVTLLSSTLKFEGRLILQAQGEGALRLLMAECSHHLQVRGIARIEGELPDADSFSQLFAQGRLALTIEPANGQRYQGVVPMEQGSLAECLEDYFSRSEQLPTRIQLACDGERAAGMLLQVLPAAGGGSEDWNRIGVLADTLTQEELLTLDNESMLYRLFHEEECRLYEAQTLAFHCDCSRERCGRALQLVGRDELLAAAGEQGGHISVDCQFCNTVYQFDREDILELTEDQRPSGETLH
ncbi:Hsp33 family molecular chaperone HslO [Nitrincola sp.]|uniref:Hsp33 family molecular chaperone HslO n=1 Tax=Nitrincola sp. TaxID=1926584 RepID=UPI003A95845B